MSDTPLEIAASKKERDRLDQLRDRRRPQQSSSSALKKDTVLSNLEQLKEQVAIEINERTTYLESLRGTNLPASDEKRIRGEIIRRVAELELLEKK